ncbi:hypothetical protein GCM10028825_07120 [Spirosoma agri]
MEKLSDGPERESDGVLAGSGGGPAWGMIRAPSLSETEPGNPAHYRAIAKLIQSQKCTLLKAD